MAAFRTILEDLTRSSRAHGAAMLAGDGEVVELYSGEASVEMDLIGAHHTIVYNMAKDAAAAEGGTGISSVGVTTGASRLLITSLKDGYCLVLAMDRKGYMGRALFESRKAARLIEEEMG